MECPRRGGGVGPHRLSLGELVDKLVEIADLAGQRLLDLLDPLAADQTLDLTARGIEPGSSAKEVSKLVPAAISPSSPSCE
jgi:hypothetical protein